MNKLKLYRQRFIPQESILLKDDIIITQTEEIIITSWKTINPKPSFSHGASCYFLKEGFKLSKFYSADNTLLYYYCDIIDTDMNATENALTCIDLLADVVVYPDFSFKVLDVDELADAYESGLITADRLLDALRKLDHLLKIIQSNHFPEYIAVLDDKNL